MPLAAERRIYAAGASSFSSAAGSAAVPLASAASFACTFGVWGPHKGAGLGGTQSLSDMDGLAQKLRSRSSDANGSWLERLNRLVHSTAVEFLWVSYGAGSGGLGKRAAPCSNPQKKAAARQFRLGSWAGRYLKDTRAMRGQQLKWLPSPPHL